MSEKVSVHYDMVTNKAILVINEEGEYHSASLDLAAVATLESDLHNILNPNEMENINTNDVVKGIFEKPQIDSSEKTTISTKLLKQYEKMAMDYEFNARENKQLRQEIKDYKAQIKVIKTESKHSKINKLKSALKEAIGVFG